jgi:hypothetical protein
MRRIARRAAPPASQRAARAAATRSQDVPQNVGQLKLALAGTLAVIGCGCGVYYKMTQRWHAQKAERALAELAAAEGGGGGDDDAPFDLPADVRALVDDVMVVAQAAQERAVHYDRLRAERDAAKAAEMQAWKEEELGSKTKYEQAYRAHAADEAARKQKAAGN